MTAHIKVVALVLAGILSCQGVTAPPPETEPPVEVETAAPAELPEELESTMIYPGWLPLSCTKVPDDEDRGTILNDEVPGHDEFPHTFTVYLPPYYDPQRQYDLLIFLGPDGGQNGDCIVRYHSTWYTEIFRFRTIFDNLILEKRVKPFIMVQPDYREWKDLQFDYDAVARNIKEEFLPYVADNYGTYAYDGSYESLVAARDHIIMGGCSLGGKYTLGGLMPNCLDVCANFLPMSSNMSVAAARDRVLELSQLYPIKKLIYTVGGIEEMQQKMLPDHLMNMYSEILTDQNFHVIEIEGTHHHYSTWGAGLWNSLQYILRDDVVFPPPEPTYPPEETDTVQ